MIGFRCHECIYCERHYTNNTTWSECKRVLKTFAEFTYGLKVDGRKKACEYFIPDSYWKLSEKHKQLSNYEIKEGALIQKETRQ